MASLTLHTITVSYVEVCVSTHASVIHSTSVYQGECKKVRAGLG